MAYDGVMLNVMACHELSAAVPTQRTKGTKGPTAFYLLFGVLCVVYT